MCRNPGDGIAWSALNSASRANVANVGVGSMNKAVQRPEFGRPDGDDAFPHDRSDTPSALFRAASIGQTSFAQQGPLIGQEQECTRRVERIGGRDSAT